jgi:PAS domain S-box-containing protein
MTAMSDQIDTSDPAARAVRIIESMPGFAWSADPEGQFTYVSPNTQRFLGRTRDDLNMLADDEFGWRSVVHPDDYDRVAARWRHSLSSGEHYDAEHRLRGPDGEYRWFRNSGTAVRDDNGAIVQWHGTTLEIDNQKQLETRLVERERELSLLVDMVPSHVWRLTAEGEATYFNQRMEQYLGFGVADLGRDSRNTLQALIKAVHPDDASAFGGQLLRSLETGDVFQARYRLRRADGVYHWMSSRAEPLRDDTGTVVQWYGVCHDIDDQMRLYSDIAEREARIRRLVDSDIIGIVIWDLDGTLIDANDAFLRMVQYDRKDVEAGLRWFDMTPPDWQDVHAQDEAEELAATGKMQAREKEYFRKDGTRVPVLIGAACFEGQSRQGVAYILDLTERKRAEAMVRERERELSQLVDMVPSYLWRLTPDGVPTFFNRRLIDFLGVDVESADWSGGDRLTAFIASVIHPDDAADVVTAFERSLATGERLSMKWRMRRADGAYRWMASSAEAMRDQAGHIVQWYGLCHDMDDQMLAETALRNSKQQLQQMIDALPINILSFAPSRQLTYASQRYHATVGPPLSQIQDFEALARDVAHPDDLSVMLQRALNGFATGEPFVNRFRRRCSDGIYRWIEARAQALRDADGRIVQWYIVSIDIEEEMQAQEALRERERFLWQLVETLPAMIDCAAPDGEPVYRSQQLREFLGYNLDDLDREGKPRLAGTLDAGVHPDEVAGVRTAYAHSLTTGEPYRRRHRLRRHDGEYLWVETRAAPMRDTTGAIVQWNVICLDIDAEVKMQEELRFAHERLARASQAASLAELSASIAHEVNQPLAAVVANSHACQRWLSSSPPNVDRAKVTAGRIVRDANSAAEVVSRIRALFRQSNDARTTSRIDVVIEEVTALMKLEAMRKQVSLSTYVEPKLPELLLDRVQLQQVLVNLMRNAIEAVEDRKGARTLQVRASALGDAVRVEVSDNGGGLQHPDRIFESFFTTKEKGMGMGLAICRSIIESHGGRLWAEPNAEAGTTFVFTLPLEAKAVA